MKKSLMSNIKNFVDSNVRHRIDKAAHNNNEFFTDDLLLVERHFEDIRQVCIDAEKKISTLLQSIHANGSVSYTQNVQAGLSSLSQNLAHQTASLATGTGISSNGHSQQSKSNTSEQASLHHSDESLSNHSCNQPAAIHQGQQFISRQQSIGTEASVLDQSGDAIPQRFKKLPVVGFLRFLIKANNKLKPDSLLGTAFSHCTQLQVQLTKLYLSYEQTIESQCLKPIQHMLEVEIPNIVKLRKLFIKSHNDLESFKSKYNGFNNKQQLAQQTSNPTSYTVTQNNLQQTNANKLEQLRKELDEALMRYEQAKVCIDSVLTDCQLHSN